MVEKDTLFALEPFVNIFSEKNKKILKKHLEYGVFCAILKRVQTKE